MRLLVTTGHERSMQIYACVRLHAFKILLSPLHVFIACVQSYACVSPRTSGYVYASVVINILNHFNYKKGKIVLVGQKQLREL